MPYIIFYLKYQHLPSKLNSYRTSSTWPCSELEFLRGSYSKLYCQRTTNTPRAMLPIERWQWDSVC